MKSNKAVRPDEVPLEVLKLTAEERPGMLLDMYNARLTRCIFPIIGKKQRQVFAYRVLCMLNSAEKIIKISFKSAVESAEVFQRDSTGL